MNWNPNVLAPIIGGLISVESLSDIKNKHFVQNVTPINIGYFPGTYTVPPLFIKHVGPFAYQLSQYFSFAAVDSASLTITFNNAFPIKVSKGTRIVFRSSADTSSSTNIIYSHTIQRDIAPDSAYHFNTILNNTTVYNNLYLSLDSFLSPGGKANFNNQNTIVDFKINVIKVNKVGIFTNKEYTYFDSTDVDLSSTANAQSINDSSASGIIRTFITNLIPANVHFQMYFFDGNHKFIDSLYHGTILSPASTNDTITGMSLNTVQKMFDFPINAKRINALKQTKHVIYKVKGDTYGMPGKQVIAGKQTGANVLIVSNMKINLGSFINNNH